MHAATPAAKDWPHVKLLAEYLDALFEGASLRRPGPRARAVRDRVRGGRGRELYPVMVHPERGDPAVYNFAIHMPPRHGKSFLVSEHLPAYLLTKYPTCPASRELRGHLRRVVGRQGARPHLRPGGRVRDHARGRTPGVARQLQDEGHRGEFRCAGAGGSITGRGGHWLILDDPIANSEEARPRPS